MHNRSLDDVKTSASEPDCPADGSDIEDAIFETAIHIEDAEQRQAYLERSFHRDPEGLARMQELVALAGESAAFFIQSGKHRGVLAKEALGGIDDDPHPSSDGLSSEDRPGEMIGRYRLVRRIGSGGCGVVYEAEQQEPVRRRVALKVIRLGMDTETVISRFEIERQALALMDHPNIARVLDAGATREGRPYFVMELVKGERLTTYCDAEKLDLAQRLGLFIPVCHAIQHAHQKGIIHRDIKPSNILVAIHDDVPVPKVIDFGIAKATERVRGTMSTVADQPLGTPAYMSPEQIDMGALDIDTRSDVYGLGALLYELLAGRPPFDGDTLMRAGMSEMRRTLLEKDPPFPAASFASAGPEAAEIARRRRCDQGKLISQLRGDLGWIVMKALEKDRNRRYQTANSLAMDVQRYLDSEPVIARRPGRLYLAGKLIRRNRLACLSAAAVAVSLIVGMGASTLLYLRERDALTQMELLRQDAESARAEEARLRQQAQARANVSRVAVLLSEGEIEKADALLNETPLSFIDPSPEAAEVFRSLGNWNAIYGRWEQAAQCFTLLNQANRLDRRGDVVEGLELLQSAPCWLESGDIAGYERFRRDILDRYLPAKTSLEAEHLLKACLLLPIDAHSLERMESTAGVCASDVSSATGLPVHPDWQAFSITLYHFRRGDSEQVAAWAEKCLAYPDDSGTRTASTLCLTAMNHHRLGDREQAHADLEKAREMIPSAPDLDENPNLEYRGFWFSWAIARVLLREAADVVKP